MNEALRTLCSVLHRLNIKSAKFVSLQSEMFVNNYCIKIALKSYQIKLKLYEWQSKAEA